MAQQTPQQRDQVLPRQLLTAAAVAALQATPSWQQSVVATAGLMFAFNAACHNHAAMLPATCPSDLIL